MMKKSIKISIPNPCSKDWNQMLPAEKGRYCKSCNKCVSDFTKFSDSQLNEFFSKPNDKICGQFNLAQIDRTLIIPRNQDRKQCINPFLMSLFVTLGIVNAEAKELVMPEFQIELQGNLNQQKENREGNSADSSYYISGRITDNEIKKFLPFVSVAIKGSDYKVRSDFDGQFKLPINDSILGKEITLLFDAPGYESKEIVLTSIHFPLSLDINLIMEQSTIRGAIHAYEVPYISIIEGKKMPWWRKLFYRKSKSIDYK